MWMGQRVNCGVLTLTLALLTLAYAWAVAAALVVCDSKEQYAGVFGYTNPNPDLTNSTYPLPHTFSFHLYPAFYPLPPPCAHILQNADNCADFGCYSCPCNFTNPNHDMITW